MHDSPTIPPSSHDALLSLLAHWENEKEKGNILTPETLCKDHPELLHEVREKLKQLKQSPLNTVDCEAPTIAPSDGSDTEPNIASSTPNVLPNIPGFHIESELGRGGMGVVYLARQIRLNRPVALKMIISGEHASADTRLRFLAEAEAIAKLHHPGIVQVHEFGTHDNNPFFALEYVPGGSLDKKLAGTPLPPKEAADLVAKLADAVQAAHDQGIIHRDLKPANILLSSPLPSAGEGSGVRGLQSVKGLQPKITDFGLVKKAGSDMTATGQILGTPSYMAPEQADGKKAIGPAVDIYALGAILYECLTGRPPFKAATPLDTILQVVNDEPVSIRQLQAKTPMDLETICHKCLQKDAGKRYGSAAAFGEDLQRYLNGETIQARPVGRTERAWRWCRRHPAVAGMSVGIAAILIIATTVASLLAWWALENRDKANANAQFASEQTTEAFAQKKRAEEENRASRRLLGISRVERGMSEWLNGDNQAALLWFTDQTVVDPENERSQIATRYRIANYRRHSTIPKVMHATVYNSRVDFAAFSPDGRQFVVPSPDTQIIDSQSGRMIKSLQVDDIGRSHVAYSHNGKRIAVCGFDKVYLLDANTGLPICNPLLCKYSVSYAEFSSDDRFLLTVSRNVIIWDLSSNKPAFEPAECKDRTSCASFSSDGKLMVTGEQDGTVRIWDIFTKKQISPPNKCQYLTQAKFSPDDKSVLTVGYGSVHLWNVTNGQPVGSKFQYQSPVSRAMFHPNGSKLYVSCEDGSLSICDIVNGKQLVAPFKHTKWVTSIDLARDGRFIATGSADGSVCVRDTVSGKPVMPILWHPDSVNHVCFNSDGTRLITTCGDFITKRGEVRVWNTTADVPNLRETEAKYELVSFNNDVTQAAAVSSKYRGNSDREKNSIVHFLASDKPSSIASTIKYNGWINHVSFSLDGKSIVTSHGINGEAGEARIWNVHDNSMVSVLPHKNRVNYSCFSLDGKYVLTSGEDGILSIWDAKTGKHLSSPGVHFREVIHGSFSVDSKYAISASGKPATKGSRFLMADGIIGYQERNRPRCQIWDIAKGISVASLGPTTGDDGYCFAKFSHNSKLAVTCSKGGHAQLWHVTTGEPATPPLQHQGEVCQSEFSPDDRLIVTSSADRTARIWNTSTGLQTTPPLQHQEYVIAARFSHHGHCIATASADKTARLWDPDTGQPLSPPLIHDDTVFSIAFSPDDKYLMTGTRYGVKKWSISPDPRPFEDILHSVQYQSVSKLDQVGTRIPLEHNSELHLRFQDFRSKYPADFSVTPDQARRWRLQQIADCCKEQNLPAALFHQNWLLTEAVQEAATKK